MQREEIFKQLKGLLINEYGCEAINIVEEAQFHTDLEMDSLEIIELVMKVEDEFGVSIDHGTLEIKTVGQLVDLLVTLKSYGRSL